MKQKELLNNLQQNKNSNHVNENIANQETFDDVLTREFRRPLTVIRHYCREIIEKCSGALEEQYRGYLVEIDEQLIRMGEQVDILFNSPQINRSEVHTDTVDLAEISKIIIESLMLTQPERRVKFITAVSVQVKGNAHLLRIALRNLLKNAWRNTSQKEETVIELGISKNEGSSVYFIRDNGIGFDVTAAEHLLKHPGTGDQLDELCFGPDTVRKIIHSHGGEIWSEGKVGIGATFYFTLGMH